jgi:CHAT domain-containing protein/tetratricopeptide (TPR) repeat protein
MRSLKVLALGVLVMTTLCDLAVAAEPVAIVYSLAGEASLAAPGANRRPLRRFDRLPAGAAVEVGTGSLVALAFANGRRYELGERSRVALGPKDLASQSGAVRDLPRVPPLPRLSPIAAKDRPGARAGAVRVRREKITGLSPDHGRTSLASAVRLRFDPVPAAPKYRVQIVNQKGEALFHIDTEATEVSVPPGILAPGKTYLWTVETRDRPGAVARGEATLVVLDAGRARAREELRRWVQRSGAADDVKLLEGVDRTLGLWEGSHDDVEARCPFSAPGLVIETVAPESAGFRAGLMPGDQLLSWCRAPQGTEGCAARGDLHTPFDWLSVQMVDVQRGGVVVEGTRGAEHLRWNLLPTIQGLTVAPLFQGELAEIYKVSRDREQAGDPASAAKELERAAERAEEHRCSGVALWLRARAGQLYVKARQWTEADAEYQGAVAKAQVLGAARVEVHLQVSWSEAFLPRGDAAQARRRLERALELEEKHHPEGLGVAAVLTRLGNVITNLADPAADPGEEERLYRRAYDLALRAAPGSGAEAAGANNLAMSAYSRGDLERSESYASRALAIREKLTPSGDAIIPSLVTYGNVLYARGELAGAEAAFLRAKRILEKLQPENTSLAKTLHNLGVIAFHRGDFDAAESLYQRELALYERLDPSGRSVLDSLIGLGELALQRGQADKAEESWRRALAISPAGPKGAWCLRGLAGVAKLQGRNAEAEKLLRQALEIWQKINPEAIDAGSIYLKLGLLLLDQGDTGAAEAHLRSGIRIQEKNRSPLPDSYHALARLQARGGQVKEAAATYLTAVDVLESQRIRVGGAQESQWLFGSFLGNLYFEAAEHQILLGNTQKAWELVERGRARGFQALLAQRDLRFAGELPAELYAERRRLAAEYDRAQAALTEWMPEQDEEKLTDLEGRLRDLRLEQAKIQEQIRRFSPRIGALEKPAPLDLAAARSALDPGTVLLTYAVGESRSFLFVIEATGVSGPGLFLYPLPVGREDLKKEIEAFRSLLGRPDTLLPEVKQRGRHLYDLLVRPAEPVLAKADRWLISPDGPLHSLPFAALFSGGQYLVESRPIHIAASAAVYKEIRETRSEKPSAARMEFLALGDPLYPALENDAETDPQVQDALRRGLRLQRLPATRSEVKAISDLFPRTRVLLGRDATEEAIKTMAPQARRLHFACHGLLDEKFPLNSALALSIPEQPEEGRDNGLLQAWEVFEELRLEADLVTLSACDSGLGKELGGEGLVGLARAFQFAGARSVLASLWSVADVSTARFMKRFYGHLRGGKSKDEALRAAQVEQIREGAGASHPFYWGAFQLFGDWR